MKHICPNCKEDLTGEKIPEKYLHYYAAGTIHYSKLVGISTNDRIKAWECPMCRFQAESLSVFQK